MLAVRGLQGGAAADPQEGAPGSAPQPVPCVLPLLPLFLSLYLSLADAPSRPAEDKMYENFKKSPQNPFNQAHMARASLSSSPPFSARPRARQADFSPFAPRLTQTTRPRRTRSRRCRARRPRSRAGSSPSSPPRLARRRRSPADAACLHSPTASATRSFALFVPLPHLSPHQLRLPPPPGPLLLPPVDPPFLPSTPRRTHLSNDDPLDQILPTSRPPLPPSHPSTLARAPSLLSPRQGSRSGRGGHEGRQRAARGVTKTTRG